MDHSSEKEEDLYCDLPNFKYGETIDELKAKCKEHQTRVAHLEEVIEKQSKELEECRSQCATLTKNISSLLKTAQTEVKRKDQKINELNKTVIELRTEVLTLRKRKHNFGSCDEFKQSHNKEPVKRPKLQAAPSDPLGLEYSCKPATTGNNVENEELPNPDNLKSPVVLEKQVAPDIKCHTLYSQRMYNKIYNVNNKTIAPFSCSDKNEEALQVKNSNVIIKKENLIINQTKSDNNITSRTTTTTTSNATELPSDNRQHKTSLNLHDKNISSSANRDPKQLVLNYRTDSTEINTDVDSVGKIISLARDNSLNKSHCDQILKSTGCIEEKKQVIISKTNRSVNFSESESILKSIHLEHYKEEPAISSASINEKILSSEGDLEASDKINSECDKNQVQSDKKVNSIEISSPKGSSNKLFTSCIRKDEKRMKHVICPISSQWEKINKTTTATKTKEVDIIRDTKSNTEPENDEKLDIMDKLFGSPLKWTDNSGDDLNQVADLSPPTAAFEDSCSAHIENVKFKEKENNLADACQTKITEMSLTKKFSYTERKCYFQPFGLEANNFLTSFGNKEKSDASTNVPKQSRNVHWLFSNTSNEIPSKNIRAASPTFSSFVTTETTSEACDVPPSLISEGSTVNIPLKFIKSPKYNDSILGQFDDTTQLINALAKDPSKLSPIHTPVKESNSNVTIKTTPPSQIEKSCFTSLTTSSVKMSISVSPPISSADKKVSVVAGPVLSVDKEMLIPCSEVSSPVKPNKSFDKKMTPLVSPVKKISIPASVISSVEKKLSFPTTVSSSANKKVDKKTILLEQPINILSPRKTPRQIGRYKQNSTKNQNHGTPIKNKTNQIVQNEFKEIKSPSPEIKSPSPLSEKGLITESCSTHKILTANVIKNYKEDLSIKKSCSVDNAIKSHVNSSLEEKSRNSKSPLNVRPNREAVRKSDNVSRKRNSTGSSKLPSRKELSPIKEYNRHLYSRKENSSRRREHWSPSRKENSPLRMMREKREGLRYVKPILFKRPESRRESFRRPNCYFRQSSVDRKIAKDLRYSFKTRSTPVRTQKTDNGATCSRNEVNSKIRQVMMSPAKNNIISRSSRISWSASTGVVFTKTSNAEQNSDFTGTPSPEMKWVLRPIDFDTGHHSTSTKCYNAAVPGGSSPPLLISKNEIETPISKPSTVRESRFVSPDRNSPSKPIVIVAKKRPVKFGCTN